MFGFIKNYMGRVALRYIIKTGQLDDAMEMLTRTLYEKYDVKAAKKYPNAEAEVAKLLQGLPELEPRKDQLLIICKNCRNKAGLPI